ncbi:hypothetical protein CAP36_14475 [Chitinophagaceae bacterium IBVUCB2]|nr:hypothetical protein CAP36_14475 [Chitinophagaceae bacterium IBVUCB2]
MNRTLHRCKKNVIIIGCLLLSNTLPAQIEFKNPAYLHRDNQSISLEKITVSPNSIIFELEYDGGKVWKYMKSAWASHFAGTPYLSIDRLGDFSLTDGTRPPGTPASSFELYNGPVKMSNPPKKKTHIVQFPFRSSRLFLRMFNDRYTTSDNYLVMNFAECSSKNPVKDWVPFCINFRGISISFTNKQLHLLYLQNYLANELIKNEFETSADFAKRTHKDSLLNGMLKKFDALEDVFEDQIRQRISKVKPTVTYNADKQQFTLNYSGVGLDPVIINVPLAQAQQFKENFLNGSLKVCERKMLRRTDANYYISNISFMDAGQKKYEFDNLYGENKNAEWKKAYSQEVFKELERLYPKGKIWGELK